MNGSQLKIDVHWRDMDESLAKCPRYWRDMAITQASNGRCMSGRPFHGRERAGDSSTAAYDF